MSDTLDFISRLRGEALDRFKEFQAGANPTGLHPKDWDRFYVFAAKCDHTIRDNVSGSLLAEYLNRRSFKPQVAEDLGNLFDHLLRFMNLNGDMWEA